MCVVVFSQKKRTLKTKYGVNARINVGIAVLNGLRARGRWDPKDKNIFSSLKLDNFYYFVRKMENIFVILIH
jgi:hypothetical protein